MPNLLALSFEGPVAPSFALRCLDTEHSRPDGWGLAYYPGGAPSASVLKEPAPPTGSIRSELVRAWDHLEASVFMLHVRHARWGANTDANTQPFVRCHGGRDWTLAHAGSLEKPPVIPPNARFEPVGATDTERVFCALLENIAHEGWRSIAECDLDRVRTWLQEWNRSGVLNVVLSDGEDIVAYADSRGEEPLSVATFAPPYERAIFADGDVELDLTRRGAKPRRGVLVTSSPMTSVGDTDLKFHHLEPGHMVVIREGYVRFRSQTPASNPTENPADNIPLWPVALGVVSRRDIAEPHRYEIRHKTVYRYEKAVERSSHLFRLAPKDSRFQKVENHEVQISVPGVQTEFEDVFGNRCLRVELATPWTELVVEARSVVEVSDDTAWRVRPRHLRATVPHVWMPWQHHVLAPYLLPTELFETELLELQEYAQGFVRRSDGDLVETLLAINATIFREYSYRPGSTNIFTTPFDVYVQRRGVCQDFANLFICLARLLGIPARYVCGYVWVGSNPTEGQSAMAQASHAWVEVYVPDVGWKGFDPTNGSLVRTEHIRTAVGRNYRDATPTSGTLFVGGGKERLDVSVETTRIPISK
jgi:transglutaminase-like putative cysteine protease/predicted glutamine amidotransferase